MRVLLKIPSIFAIINYFVYIIFCTIGNSTKGEVPPLSYIFYIVRVEYLLISGLISIISIVISLGTIIFCIIKKKKEIMKFIWLIILNVIYFFIYMQLLSMQ